MQSARQRVHRLDSAGLPRLVVPRTSLDLAKRMVDLFVSRVKGCLPGWSGRNGSTKKSACLPEGEADAIVMLRKSRVKTAHAVVRQSSLGRTI